MKVFMLGWEFPPVISGGLGTACYGLTRAMSKLGTEVLFVLPKSDAAAQCGHVEMSGSQGSACRESEVFKNVHFQAIRSSLKPYVQSSAYNVVEEKGKRNTGCPGQSRTTFYTQPYKGDMQDQVGSYAKQACDIARSADFDVIHAHDWMTYPAGIAAAQATGKPLVVHVHSTEFDRSGENVNQRIYDIEKEGMNRSSKVIAVSNYTKNIILNRYGIAPDKVEVVYNGVECTPETCRRLLPTSLEKTVLFLGRMTMQKGPEYFLAAAKKVLEILDDVKFIMAGDGDMIERMMDYAAGLGVSRNVTFTRFLRGAEVDNAYRMADLYVMPSVSEPFGIASLEALRHGVPVLISKQSGVAETLRHVLKVDFWDIHQMANKMVAVLKYAPLRNMLSENGFAESAKYRWEDAAAKINAIYKQIGLQTSQVRAQNG
jgi:glycosyltransferase involved in cell wall biosynthesis